MSAPNITAGQVLNGKFGAAFSQTPSYTGTINSWSATGLPAGLSINSTSGLISGTPTVKGSFQSTISIPYFFTQLSVNNTYTTSHADPRAGGLLSDGTVVAWGDNYYGQATIPAGLNGVVKVSFADHALALKSDGTVVGWGRNDLGQATIPAGLNSVRTVIATGTSSVAVKNDGTVVTWGSATSIPTGLTGVKDIALRQGGESHGLALKTNGTVVAWPGNSGNHAGEGTTPYDETGVGLSNIVAIDVGYRYSVALRSDGRVFSWGMDDNVGIITGVIAISAAYGHCLGLKSDGTVVAWAWSETQGNVNVPAGLNGVVAVEASNEFSFAIKSDGTVVRWGSMGYPYALPSKQYAVQFSITEGAPIITASQTASGTVGTSFSKTFSLTDSTNRPVTSWAATGLPAGLSINASTGAITGTPQDSGSSTITLTAAGPGGTDTETATISIAVGPPIITAGQSFTGTFGLAFSQTPALTDAVDRPATSWVVTGLPAGLTLNTTTGAITGAPTTTGSFTASFTATGSGGTSAATNISFTIPEGAPIITASQTASGTVGTSFSKTFSLTDSTNRPVTSWAATGLPAGLSINASTGAITGTPQTSGSSTITLTAAGPGGTDTETATISIVAAQPPSITAGQVLSGSVGVAFSRIPELAGGTATSWAATGLPAGLSINASTGAITGTPQDSGSYTITLTAAGPAGTDTETATVFITLAGPSLITKGQVLNGKVGDAFSQTPSYTGTINSWSATGLPAGLSISSTSGLISGAPTAIGSYEATITYPVCYTSIGAGRANLAVKQDGTIVGWANYAGYAFQRTGENVGQISGVHSIKVGDRFSVAITHASEAHIIGSTYGTGSYVIPDVLDASAGGTHALFLKSNGTVVSHFTPDSFGASNKGQAQVPAGLTGVVKVAAGAAHSLALKADGSVIGWGNNSFGEINIPAGLTNVTAIAAGGEAGAGAIISGGTNPHFVGYEYFYDASFSLALKGNGTVVGWGSNTNGVLNLPAGLTGVVKISAGRRHALALKSDGTVVQWGDFSTPIPAGLTNVVEIAAGDSHNLAIRDDGSLVEWGPYGQGDGEGPYVQTEKIFFTITEGAPIIPQGQTFSGKVGTAFSRSVSLTTDNTNRPVNSWGVTGLPRGLVASSAYPNYTLPPNALKFASPRSEFNFYSDERIQTFPAPSGSASWPVLDNGGQLTGGDLFDAVFPLYCYAPTAGYYSLEPTKVDDLFTVSVNGSFPIYTQWYNFPSSIYLNAGVNRVVFIYSQTAWSGAYLYFRVDGITQWFHPTNLTDCVGKAVNQCIPPLQSLSSLSQGINGLIYYHGREYDNNNNVIAANRGKRHSVVYANSYGVYGTPETYGSFTATVSSAGPGGADTETIAFSIVAGPPIITEGQSFTGQVGVAFSQTPALTDEVNRPATSWAVTGTLPAGLTLNTTTGAITGTPTTIESRTVVLTATGSGGASAATYISLTISEGVPIITAGQMFNGTAGVGGFSRTPALTDSTNRPVTSWAATGLPAGLSINASTGAITGTPTVVGVSTITLSATGPGGTGTETAVISVNGLFHGQTFVVKAYLGTTPLFNQGGSAREGFAYIEGTAAGGGGQSLVTEFKHSAGTLTIFGNVTSTKDFHLCEGSSAAPANCVITGTLTQTNAGPQGTGGSPRGFTVAQSATNVGTLTINGANISLFGGVMIGDNQSTGANGTIVVNSGTFATNGGVWLSGPTNTIVVNGGTMSMTNCYIGGGGNGTTNPNPVSVLTINGGTFNISQPVAINQSNMIFGVSTAGVSSTNTVNLNGGTLKHNHITANTPAAGRTQTNTINFNGGTLDLDKGASRAFPFNTPVGVTWNLIIKNGGAILSVASATTMTMAVAFSNDGTNGGLTKIGPGTLDLGNLNHSYNGATTISAGTITRAVTTGSSTGTATFGASTLSVSFNVAPPTGTTTFKFFPGATTNSYGSVTLTGVSAGTTATYNSANSTLSVVKP